MFSCYYIFHTAGIWEDAHLFEMSLRIMDKQELQHLGLKVLKVPSHTVDSATYNEKEIQDAAHKLLKTWYQNQINREEAYKNLYTALWDNGLRLLAGDLKQLVTGAKYKTPLSEHGK